MAGSLKDKLAELMQRERFEAEKSTRCKLCNLPKEQAEALEMLMETYRTTGKPTLETMDHLLNSVGIKTSASSLRKHYRYHWAGANGKAQKPATKNR